MDSPDLVYTYDPQADNPAGANDTEWLLADGLGGYAMGSASGMLTRRYHGLLIAALKPPVERVVLVSQIVETLILDSQEVWLTPMRFAGGPDPADSMLTRFERGPGWVRWLMEVSGVSIEKRLERGHGCASARVSYKVRSDRAGVLSLRPLVALRDFHSLRTGATEPVKIEPTDNTLVARSGVVEASLAGQGCRRIDEREDWAELLYQRERERGQDCIENLVVPCRFELAYGKGGGEASLALASGETGMPGATTRGLPRSRADVDGEHDCAEDGESWHHEASCRQDESARRAIVRLVEAADQFVVRRGEGDGVSVIAGYPWFSDWGRDTMISLPGLLLETGRHAEALATLRVFGRALRNGLIPNRFDDYAGGAHYNTVDASLWYLHAAAAWREASHDHAGYMEHLRDPCLKIIEAYRTGTDYDIHMDTDGLIAAGNPDTQLTWMDAQRDGVTFTPRFGKCVEINALWHHGLVRTAEAVASDEPKVARDLGTLADRVRASFAGQFINPQGGLYDRLEPECSLWKPVAEIRPNQVFAASLSASPADVRTRRSVLEVIENHLLTPFGLRTLAPSDPGYVGQYRGTLFERDRAYHNGTVWPWLIGAYVEGVLRSADDLAAAKQAMRTLLGPLTARLDGWCLGQVSEVCDGDFPHRPDGCPAQAWSVAELLHSLTMCTATGDLEPPHDP
jgi:glycogen debranching enzyme